MSAAHRVRRVAVITGTRAEYGLLRSVMQAIRSTRSLRLQTIVAGMHLLRRFGVTARSIERDGFVIDARVPMQRGDDATTDQGFGLGRGVCGITRALEKNRSDIVVVLGDRIEAMAGALAAVTTGRVLAHIHGGDLAPGDFDDSLRHAITKLAHIHFPATKASARRIIRMGESPHRVHVVGAPGLDRLRTLAEEYRGRKRKHGDQKTALIVYHACGRSATFEQRVMGAILRAVDRAGLSATCIYPNSDRGFSGVVSALERFRDRCDPHRFRFVKSLQRDDFLRALLEADLIVGNSSCGIIEACTAGTATVDIGPRQRGREVSGKSVVHVDEDYGAICEGIVQALRKRPIIAARSVYGEGCAGKLIAEHLKTFSMTSPATRKLNAY